MSKKQRIEFKNLNVGNLMTFIDNATAGNFNHTFELSPTEISCRAFPIDRKFVKYTGANVKDIFTINSLPEYFESLKIPIYALDKLKTALSVISDVAVEDASGYIDYEADEKNGGLVATSINFKGKKISNKVKATDQIMFGYMQKSIFDQFCNTDGYILKFNVERAFKEKVQQLFKLEKESTFTIKYTTDKPGVITFFSGDEWAYELDGVEVNSQQNFAFDMPKDVINRMRLPLYTVYFTTQSSGKTVMKSYSDDFNILVNEVVPHDPNRLSVKK